MTPANLAESRERVPSFHSGKFSNVPTGDKLELATPDRAMALAATDDLGRTLIELVRESGIAVEAAPLGDAAGQYQRENRKIVVNCDYPLLPMLDSVIHEARHVWQYKVGIPEITEFEGKYALALCYLKEADASAVAALVRSRISASNPSAQWAQSKFPEEIGGDVASSVMDHMSAHPNDAAGAILKGTKQWLSSHSRLGYYLDYARSEFEKEHEKSRQWTQTNGHAEFILALEKICQINDISYSCHLLVSDLLVTSGSMQWPMLDRIASGKVVHATSPEAAVADIVRLFKRASP